MSKFAKTFALLAFFAGITTHSAVNFPYPQEASYGNGTINTTSANASATLKGKFNTYLTKFYKTGSCSNKFAVSTPCARIAHDGDRTVSEGIGYGMIMMVYFSDNTTSYQDHLDKLWIYYQNWVNNNGLMNWDINAFSSINGSGAATDAEFDVALALAMAYYQFGGENYRTAASDLIAKIRQHEMESNGLHKPGDSWGNDNSKKNPSYVSPAAFEVFKDFDDAEFWDKALAINYTMLKNNQNQTTGLPTDWCSPNGALDFGDYYAYDAARAPWRWAWSNAWFGHADAKTLLSKIAPWVNSKDPSSLKGTIKADGTEMWDHFNSTMTGPLMNTLSYSSAYQTKYNAFWNQLMAFEDEQYFNASLQVLTGLFASGNMPNLKALSEGVSSSSSEEAPTQSSSSSDDETQSSSSSSDGNHSSSSSDLTPIAISKAANGPVRIHAISNAIVLENLPENTKIEVYNLRGAFVYSANSENSQILKIPVQTKGLYIVRYGSSSGKAIKVLVK